MKRFRYESGGLDETDARILAALVENSRISIVNLARRIGMSSPGVSERMKRLEEAGVIDNYTITVNPDALGLPLAVYLRIRPIPGEMQTVVNILKNLPEVVDCDRITGEDCFIARAHVRSVAHMEELIDKLIPVAMTNTSIVQSSPVARRLPLFDINDGDDFQRNIGQATRSR
ncbi:Lrp/AsnC family transcriptional regulator, leucine-responsive regulatory protein [Modicisalibacter ilicicola DSM 19980]|uniref:Lrp/AsnC family transcriptional regulator, leucine-responsive regulatory protein n=2 Tax=Modicisalibacter ilicicola TaxID=480814 RepID=A0A1M5A1R7_9GAMM|nr:Lrp/AsnC family transcriptional regulator, leucine-responsive regulatory protein [Halomonas ilicicola DSM 19980]